MGATPWVPALLTGAITLASFAVAHALLITPLVEPPEGMGPLVAYGVMLGAPILLGTPFALVASFLAALAWRVSRRRERLASWRFGAALALGPLPAVAAMLLVEPTSEGPPAGPVLAAVFGSAFALPGLVGLWAGGPRAAVLLGLTAIAFSAPLTPFVAAGPPVLLVGLFVAAILGVLVLSGVWMERLVGWWSRRRARGRVEETHPPPA